MILIQKASEEKRQPKSSAQANPKKRPSTTNPARRLRSRRSFCSCRSVRRAGLRIHMNKDKVALVEKIYSSLPTIACKRLCQEFCGPISYTDIEAQRIRKKHRRLPVLDLDKDRCSALEFGSCTVYELRPLICRLWGLIEAMRCPHGCIPSRWLTDKEGHALLLKIQALSPVAQFR